MSGKVTPEKQKNNPLHGVTLQQIVTELEAEYGWDELGRRINIRCFQSDPSIKSSLKFLRKTPWAREKVEQLWILLQTRQTIWSSSD
ncbi:VF530 family protein [Amphritea sp. 1_MG-2023]|uniref:VF530 family protein n=1 Tax=Amphritea sp. 1_MG-2023 TaxID=3062670 RepID=UPI0026E146CA|nr:VF530 family protein [Amphritea sp. 1_MG-2023]MDO6562945.1 VF530 family protein [Amphritea sp. 1_MG-2023]